MSITHEEQWLVYWGDYRSQSFVLAPPLNTEGKGGNEALPSGAITVLAVNYLATVDG